MTGAYCFGSVLNNLMHSIRLRFLGRLLALLAVALPLRSQTLEYLSPPRDARELPARPTLAWSFGTGNLLTNPGFEDGTNGWTVSGGTVVNLVFPNGAAEGSKAIRVNRGTVSREITLPPGPEELTLSFALRGVTQFSDSQRLQYPRVEVVDLEGVVPSQIFPVMGIFAVLGTPWYPATIDLGPFRGRPVRLTWSMPAADLRRQNWFLDAVKLTSVPAGTEFEVWLKRSRLGPFESLGRSPQPSRLLPELFSDFRHEWRVDVHSGGAVVVGRTNLFYTAHAMGPRSILGVTTPALACPGEPFLVSLRVTDEFGFPAPNTPVTFSLNAQGSAAASPGVLITEVDTGSVDGVEIQNVSAGAIDLSRWQVELFRSTDSAPSMKIPVPAGTFLSAGGRFTVAESRPANSSWPALATPGPLDWDDRVEGKPTAGVVLRDESGQVRDAVFIEVQPREISGETLPRQSRTVAPTDWRSLPLALVGASGETYQRRGDQDHNDATDWQMAPASFDLSNAALSHPFLPGFGTYLAQPTGLTNVRTDLQGWIQFPYTIMEAAESVQVQAQLRSLNQITVVSAESAEFRVDPSACFTVSLPATVREGAGMIAQGLRVQLAQPTPTNLTFHLVTDQSRLGIPETGEILAGASEWVADLLVLDDAQLTGPLTARITVSAPGYSPALREVRIEDDETTTMRWEGETRILEGAIASASLVLDRPVDVALRIPLTSNDPSRLSVTPVFIAAGTDRGWATWSPVDNTLLEDPVTVNVQATFADWGSATVPVTVIDDETNTIQVAANFNQPASEGQTIDLTIILGGASTTNRPMTITVSRPDRVQTPDYPEFPAQGLVIATSLQLREDSLVTGREEVVVEVSLPGYQTGRTTLTLIDNDPGRLSLALPIGPHAVGHQLGARLRAQTIDGDPLPGVDLSGALMTLRDNGLLPSQQETTIPSDDYHWVSVIPTTSSSRAHVRVDALGLSVESPPFSIWPNLTATGVRWASYDAVRDRIIVIDLAGALFTVDVTTGTRTDFTSSLPPADVCRVSSDGQMLHVVHSDQRRMARFNLATMALEADWDVGMNDGIPLRVDSLASVPGQPQAVVVARRYQRSESPSEPERLWDLVVFDGPQLRPERVSFEAGNFLGSTVIVSSGAQQVTLVERTRLQSYRLGPNGLSSDPDLRPSALGIDYGPESGTAVEGNGTILTLRGQWLDPLLAGELGPRPPGFGDQLFGYDPSADWFGWITPDLRPVLRLLAPHSLQVLAEMPLSELLDARTFHLEPAGPGRWLWINRNVLRLFSYPLPTLPEERDLAVTAEVTSRNLELAQADVVFHVSHSGTQSAENVTLSLGLPHGWDQLNRPAHEWAPGATEYPLENTPGLSGNRYRLGTLAPGENRDVQLRISSFPQYALGELWVSAHVGSPAQDPQPANNRAELRVSGLLAPPPELRLKPFNDADGELFLEFGTGYEHQYQVERSASLDGPWADALGQQLRGLGQPLVVPITKPTGGQPVYWRVRQIFP